MIESCVDLDLKRVHVGCAAPPPRIFARIFCATDINIKFCLQYFFAYIELKLMFNLLAVNDKM